MNFINGFQSEWLKKKRSLASWLVIVGAFFTPAIVLVARLKNHAALAKTNGADDFWQKFWFTNWESMAVLLLPMGIILATALVTQIEYKNNAWKQLHTTPQRYATIYFAKLAVVSVMLVEVFILFNLGFYLAAIVPSLVFSGAPFPSAPIPYRFFLESNLGFFVECLPILALQYLLSLRYKNFLVPVGVGFVIWVLGLGMLSWNYSYLFPYSHPGLDFLSASGHLKRELPVDLRLLALVYFVIITFVGYILYVTKSEKG